MTARVSDWSMLTLNQKSTTSSTRSQSGRSTKMENKELIRQMASTLLTLEKGYSMMYEMMMENHKRLNRLEKEFLALEKKVNEENNPR